MSRIFIINVGSNASHNFCSPIFSDRTFEFIPIPEDRQIDPIYGRSYKDLKSFYDPSQDLLKYIPQKIYDITAHMDPEFDSFTYGDNCEINPRASALKQTMRGDFLLYISRLQKWDDGAYKNDFGFYFIGYIHVNKIVKSINEPLGNIDMERFAINAHVRRAMSSIDLWDKFWLFAGSSWSKRFNRAVPVTKELCDTVFLSSAGHKWKWSDKRTDLQVIGSYTRTIRSVMDSSNEFDKLRYDILWDWINKNCS